MVEQAKKSEDASKRNWADDMDDDNEDGGDDVEIGGASVAQVGKSNKPSNGEGGGDQAAE